MGLQAPPGLQYNFILKILIPIIILTHEANKSKIFSDKKYFRCRFQWNGSYIHARQDRTQCADGTEDGKTR